MAKFALSAFADEAGSTLEEQISALKANDIDYIEPRNINKIGILNISEEELVSIRSELDKNGIKVNSLGSPIGKYAIDEPFEIHLKDFDRALRACEILGTNNIRMFSFFVTQDQLKEKRDEVLTRMNKLVSIAKEKGINLCHENESKIYGCMPNEVADLLDNVDGLYAIFDPANYRMNGADCMEGIEATLKNLRYLHIKDAICESQTIVPAGEGEGQIAKVIDIVNDHTDDVVYLTLEPHLHVFDAYASIDEHELKGTHKFTNNREAFDFAVNSLKKLLTDNGYKRNEENLWTK